MYLAGNLRIDQLLTDQMQIDDIVVRRAHLRLVRQADGEWNAAALLPLPHFSDQSPRITIEDASRHGADIRRARREAVVACRASICKLVPMACEHRSDECREAISDRRHRNGPPGARGSYRRNDWNGKRRRRRSGNSHRTGDFARDARDSCQRRRWPAATVSKYLARPMSRCSLNANDANTPLGWSAAFEVGSRPARACQASRSADRSGAQRQRGSQAPDDRAIGRQMWVGQHRHGHEPFRLDGERAAGAVREGHWTDAQRTDWRPHCPNRRRGSGSGFDPSAMWTPRSASRSTARNGSQR